MKRYRLDLNMRITEINEQGGYTGNSLNVQDELSVGVAGFMEIAGILSRFHELAEMISKEHQ